MEEAGVDQIDPICAPQPITLRITWPRRTAGPRSFFRAVPVTQRHAADRHHIEAGFDPASVGLAQELTIDVTFPGGQTWDGRRSMRLACADGQDFPAGDNPDAGKAALEASYCDPLVREPFIAALALASQLAEHG